MASVSIELLFSLHTAEITKEKVTRITSVLKLRNMMTTFAQTEGCILMELLQGLNGDNVYEVLSTSVQC